MRDVGGIRTEPLAGRDMLQARGVLSSTAPATAFGAGRMLGDMDWGGGGEQEAALHAREVTIPAKGWKADFPIPRKPGTSEVAPPSGRGAPRRTEGRRAGEGGPSSETGRAHPCSWEALSLPRCEAGALRIPGQEA